MHWRQPLASEALARGVVVVVRGGGGRACRTRRTGTSNSAVATRDAARLRILTVFVIGAQPIVLITACSSRPATSKPSSMCEKGVRPGAR